MKRTQVLVNLPLTLFVLQLLSSCGYSSLKNEYQNYQPAVSERLTLRGGAAGEMEESGGEDGWTETVRRIEQHKKSRQKALDPLAGKTDFYKPDKKRFAELKPAAADGGLAREIMANEWGLTELEILTLLRNPAIFAARDRLAASLDTFDQVIALDETLRQYSAFTESLMTGVGPMKGGSPPAATFPFPGVLALKGRVIDQGVVMAVQDLEIARRTALSAARQAYWNLFFTREAAKITRTMLSLLERLEKVARTRYEAGATGFQDVIRIRIKKEKMAEDLLTLEERETTVQAALLEMVDLPPGLSLGHQKDPIPVKTVPDPESLYGLALDQRQEIVKTRARIAKMEAMIEMAETMIYPQYTMNLSRYRDRAILQTGSSAKMKTFPDGSSSPETVALPKAAWFGREDAYVDKTRKELAAAGNDLRALSARTLSRVREGWFKLDQAIREEHLFAASIVDLSQAALDVAGRGYESGKVGFADVIDTYTSWLESNLTLARKRADIGVYRALLQESVGSSQLRNDHD